MEAPAAEGRAEAREVRRVEAPAAGRADRPRPPTVARRPRAPSTARSSRNAGPGGAADHMTDEGMVAMAASPLRREAPRSRWPCSMPKQQIVGFGAALTEVSANVVSQLPMNHAAANP